MCLTHSIGADAPKAEPEISGVFTCVCSSPPIHSLCMRAEIVREQKRAVEKSVRELEREKAGMDKTEAQLIADIKKAAKAGQKKSCTIMAKDLVRTRKHREKFTNLCAQLRVMSLSMTVWRLHASRASFCDEGSRGSHQARCDDV